MGYLMGPEPWVGQAANSNRSVILGYIWKVPRKYGVMIGQWDTRKMPDGFDRS